MPYTPTIKFEKYPWLVNHDRSLGVQQKQNGKLKEKSLEGCYQLHSLSIAPRKVPLLLTTHYPIDAAYCVQFCTRNPDADEPLAHLARPTQAENYGYGNLPESLIDLTATLKSEPGSLCPVTNPDPSQLHLSRAATQGSF